jgi:hypothetical protein
LKVSGLDHRISLPHQKRGHAFPPFALPMRSASFHRGFPRVRLSRTLSRAGTLLVLFGLVGLLAVSSARAYPAADITTYQWSNTDVTCLFNNSTPAVTVSASDRTETGMGVGLDQMAELSPTGETLALASVSSTDWYPQNQSTDQAFVMNYVGTMNVTDVLTSQVAGLVNVSVNFTLIKSASAPAGDEVGFQVGISGWPWQSPTDTLALVVPIWSAFATTEHVAVASHTAPTVDSVLTSNGQTLEYFEASPSATTSLDATIPVSAYTSITNGIATTTLTLGHGVGGASALAYEATLGISPSTRILGLPLYDYAAVAGGAGLVALVVGVGTRQIRRRPSDLTYVEEEE